jgi:hypothetical protein
MAQFCCVSGTGARSVESKRKINATQFCGYLAKYLSKERPECLQHWRLWAGFGKGWEWTKVKDVIRETLFSRIYRACKEWKNWTGRGQFCDRMDLVRQMMILTIEHD